MPAHSSTVALVRAGDYHQSRQAVERALRLLELGPDFFRGKRVALKVNMMKGAAPERALATHPEFVRALARIVRDAGGSPFVCDSSGILGFTAEAFEAAGYTAMCAEEGIELVDLDAEPPVWRSIRGRRLPGVWMGKAALEADLLVTVPKLKTHTITKLTCALKNHMGLLVGATKCRLHEMAPRPGQLAEALQAQTAELLYEALRWGEGEFAFYVTEKLPEEARQADVDLSIDKVLLEGFRRVDEWGLIEKEIRDFSIVLAPARDSTGVVKQINLNDEEKQILSLVDGERTIREIVRHSHRSSFDVCKMLYRLLGSRIVRKRSRSTAGKS